MVHTLLYSLAPFGKEEIYWSKSSDEQIFIRFPSASNTAVNPVLPSQLSGIAYAEV